MVFSRLLVVEFSRVFGEEKPWKKKESSETLGWTPLMFQDLWKQLYACFLNVFFFFFFNVLEFSQGSGGHER